MQTTPFKRANAMMAAIQVILASTPKHLQQFALGHLGSYKSRGHGKGLSGKSYHGCTNWKERLNGKTNGKRECARRLKQIAIHA